MQSFESLSSFVGLSPNSPEVRNLVQSEKLEESVEEDLQEGVPLQHTLSAHSEGYELIFADDRITTLFVYNEASDGYAAFRGAWPTGLSARAKREGVRKVFGQPERSGTAKSILLPGRLVTWDRFAQAILRLHFEYSDPDERIKKITVMLADIAP